MNNAINNQFKMNMGSKQKDTEGAFSEKDTALMKKAPLLSISSVLADDPGAPKDKFKAMSDAYKAGQEEGLGQAGSIMGDKSATAKESSEYSGKFASMADDAEKEKKKGLGIDIGTITSLLG